MKKILYGLLATLLFSNFSFAQTPLISDDQHRTMINDYATNLNSILTPRSITQGVTLDQLKRKIANGSFTLLPEDQHDIKDAAADLLDYGKKFANKNGLTIPSGSDPDHYNDAYIYFYSTFAPSTMVSSDHKLIESTTTPGLTATEMWTCALASINTDNCGSSILVSDKYDMNTVATNVVSKLTVPTGNMGILVMLDGLNSCLSHNYDLEKVGMEIYNSTDYSQLINTMNISNGKPTISSSRAQELSAKGWNNLLVEEKTELSIGFGFANTASFISFNNSIISSFKNIDSNFLSPNRITNPNDIQSIYNSAGNYYYDNIISDASQGCLKQYHLNRAKCIAKAGGKLVLDWIGVKALALDAATEGLGVLYSIGATGMDMWEMFDCLDAADETFRTCK